ncbi:MAG TPA: 30S ribosome-binding factor RbfA [Armatimonadota bacterium]
MGSTRQQRMGRLLRDEISRILHEDLHDPRLGFISITEIELTPDLHTANVYVSVYGDDEVQQQSITALERATGFIRGELGRQLRDLRFIPELQFRLDPSLARGSRVLELLRQVSPPPAEEGKDDSTGTS